MNTKPIKNKSADKKNALQQAANSGVQLNKQELNAELTRSMGKKRIVKWNRS